MIASTIRSFHRLSILLSLLLFKKGHIAGWKYTHLDNLRSRFKYNQKFASMYKFENLKFAYITSYDISQAESDESSALSHYLLKYGELPPLNWSFSWKNFEPNLRW